MNVASENKKIELLSEQDLINIGKPICLDENGNPVYIGDTYLHYEFFTKPTPRKLRFGAFTADSCDDIFIGFAIPHIFRFDD